jgi:prepilin-type N-terminal cleavage/methylation domain-containing protein
MERRNFPPIKIPALPPKESAQSGLTLIEVLIAVTLLAFVSLAISQSTIRSFSLNSRLGAESVDYTAMMLSLQAVESDIEQIFSPVVGAIPTKAEDHAEVFWSAPVRTDGLRRSRLTGSADKLTFVANNNRRVEADAPQSDFQKITWEVERNSKGTFSLYRSTDWDVYHYEEGSARKPNRVALLENLSSAKFTYYRKENKTWEERWDSEGPYVKEEERFPDLISLKIELPDPTNNSNQLPWEIVIRPNMALNWRDQKYIEQEKQKFTE